MDDIAIRTDGLSKKYHIGTRQESYRTLRDTLTDAFASPFRRARRLLQGHATGASELNETIWALKDVSFEVKKGEVIGIIGRNGAGKSTLLKILSRITEPTEGYADIYGRVGSLLEVGTGFHTELTGRENIYLNGAILGMRKAEIEKKFDEIVAFAEVEKFIDTPVKHYSTGMYLRLAFAVAAHLDPDILLVDEVLAVGDAPFQRKCLGKMGDVAKGGRTVLFVSHNIGAVENLCAKGIWLDRGAIKNLGPTYEIIQQYLNSMREKKTEQRLFSPGKEAVIGGIECIDLTGKPCSAVGMGDPLTIIIHYEVDREMDSLGFGISIENQMRQRIFGVNTMSEGKRSGTVYGNSSAHFHLPRVMLCPGTYFITGAVHAKDGRIIDWFENGSSFSVLARDMAASGVLANSSNGLVWLDHRWDI